MLRRFLNVSLIAALIVALSAALPLPTSRAQDDLIADLASVPRRTASPSRITATKTTRPT